MAPKGKALAKAAVNDKKQAAAKAVEKAKEIQESETQLVASSSKAGAGLEVLSESEIKRFKSMTAYGAQKGNTFMSKAMEQYAMAPDRAAKAMLLAKFRDDPKCRWASDMTETEADTREEAQRYIKGLVTVWDVGNAMGLPAHMDKTEYEAIVLDMLEPFPSQPHANEKLAARGHKMWNLGEVGLAVGPETVKNKNVTGKLLSSSTDLKQKAFEDEPAAKKVKVKLEFPDWVNYVSLVKSANQNVKALEKLLGRGRASATNCRLFLTQFEKQAPLDQAFAVRQVGQDLSQCVGEAQNMIDDYQMLIGFSKNVKKENEDKVKEECKKLDAMALNVVTMSQALSDMSKKADDVEAEAEQALNDTPAAAASEGSD